MSPTHNLDIGNGLCPLRPLLLDPPRLHGDELWIHLALARLALQALEVTLVRGLDGLALAGLAGQELVVVDVDSGAEYTAHLGAVQLARGARESLQGLVEHHGNGFLVLELRPHDLVEALLAHGELGELRDDVPGAVDELLVALAFWELGHSLRDADEEAGVRRGVVLNGTVGCRLEDVKVFDESLAVEAEIAHV